TGSFQLCIAEGHIAVGAGGNEAKGVVVSVHVEAGQAIEREVAVGRLQADRHAIAGSAQVLNLTRGQIARSQANPNVADSGGEVEIAGAGSQEQSPRIGRTEARTTQQNA